MSRLMKHWFRDEEHAKTAIIIYSMGLGMIGGALTLLVFWLR